MTARSSTTVRGLDRRLSAAREVTDNLFRVVRPEALYDRPIAERNRIVFYIGHVEAFDWNLLTSTLFEASGFNPGFDKLFAFGIDPVGGGLPSDRATDWPALTEIDRYARRGRETIDRALGRLAAGSVDSPGNREQILNVAIEHRLMHAETLAYMFPSGTEHCVHRAAAESIGGGLQSANGQRGRPRRRACPWLAYPMEGLCTCFR